MNVNVAIDRDVFIPLFLFSFLLSTDFDAFTRFLAIEPPLDTDYNFALTNSEGLCDLFDFDL